MLYGHICWLDNFGCCLGLPALLHFTIGNKFCCDLSNPHAKMMQDGLLAMLHLYVGTREGSTTALPPKQASSISGRSFPSHRIAEQEKNFSVLFQRN